MNISTHGIAGAAFLLFLFLCTAVPAAEIPGRRNSANGTNGTPADATSAFLASRLETPDIFDGNGMAWFYQFRNRFERKSATRLTFSLHGDYLEDMLGGDGEQWPNDIAMKKTRKVVREAVRFVFREWTAESRPVQWVKEELTGILYDAISGREERYNLSAPFEADFAARYEESWTRGFKKGIRPFRLKTPYAYVSYGPRDNDEKLHYNLTLRGYLEEWSVPRVELIGGVPVETWWFGASISVSGRNGERRGEAPNVFVSRRRQVFSSVGFEGPLLGGKVYAGVDVLSQFATLQFAQAW